MRILIIFIGLCFSFNSYADQYWSKLSTPSKSTDALNQFQLNIDQLKQDLTKLNEGAPTVISLPRSDGSLSQFNIWPTSVVADTLAEKYPSFKTFKIRHITDSTVNGRLELMNGQLSAMIKTFEGQELIKIEDQWNNTYQSKNKSSIQQKTFSCGTQPLNESQSLSLTLDSKNQFRASTNQLTKLKVAIATTAEYSVLFGNTKPLVLAELIKAVNRLNDVFESELAITLELVSNNEDIIFIDNDSFTDNDASELIDESQTVITSVIGASNYDLGHVFSTAGGGASGLAAQGSICSDNFKAQGVTGRFNPTTDDFWIDFVAHEIGHQLGAGHTFNGSSGSCSGSTRVAGSAYEPGSGSTIMAYAGICGLENIQSNSDDSFHSQSILEIDNTIPFNCGVDVSYGSINTGDSNSNSPTVNAGTDRTIPTNTPFVLTATATDLDGDNLSYQWDGTDKGTVTDTTTLGCDLKDNTLFRSNKPKQESVRYFPTIETLLNGNRFYGETLPTTDRDINFTTKVTDSKGGYATDNIKLTSVTSSNNFKVTSQSSLESFIVNDVVTVKWNVAKTSSVPISCSTVEVQLLSFSADKSTFTAQTIAVNQLNSGTAVVRLPSDGNSSASRFLVKCSTNVFFAINDSDFSITGGVSSASNNATSSNGGIEIAASSQVSALLQCPFEVAVIASSGGGGGQMPYWMLYVLSLLLMARRRF